MTTKGAWIPITDTVTGETHRYYDDLFSPTDHSRWMWLEGNWACDCNRVLFFYEAIGREPTREEEAAISCETRRFFCGPAECDDGTVVALDEHIPYAGYTTPRSNTPSASGSVPVLPR